MKQEKNKKQKKGKTRAKLRPKLFIWSLSISFKIFLIVSNIKSSKNCFKKFMLSFLFKKLLFINNFLFAYEGAIIIYLKKIFILM